MTEQTTPSGRPRPRAGGIAEQGQVWRSHYALGAHVAVIAVDGGRVRLADVTVTPQGAVALTVGRSRWASIGRLTSAYRITAHRLDTIDRADVPAPAVGQIWADNDARGSNRRRRIVEIDGAHAICEEPSRPNARGQAKPGRRTRIRLDRLRPTSTGYRYIGDA